MQRVLVLLVGILLIACGGNPQSTAALTAKLTPTPLPTDFAGNVIDNATVKDVARRNSEFAFEFYRHAASQNDQNLVFSPYSLSLAFSMLYAGAQNNTATQLADTFHFLPQNAQHRALHDLDRQVQAPPSQTALSGNTGAPFQLNIANAMWGQIGVPFNAGFTNTLSQEYKAELQQVDFQSQSAEIVQTINAWIANATADRIKELVSPDTVNSDTRLVLVNAVYFKGSWQMPFDAGATKTGTFTTPENATVQVPFMHHTTIRAPYLENDDYQALSLSYVGDRVDMFVILPKERRLQAVEATLTSATLDNFRTGAELFDVMLAMPRFEFETDLDLKKLLPELGVTAAFDGHADFGAIAQGGGLFVSDALHHSTITVDEQGTEAAAASAIAMAASAYERAEMKLDRPFLFVIVERETGTVLFLGRVMNPAP